MVGTAVGSVSHLLSELIENGLTFSPPDSEVEVQGRRMVDGYLIAVIDQGVGMSIEDLRQANGRLRGEEDFIAAPTRFLGHFVVGQLARETGTQVELLPSPVTGVTARVTLPPLLLASSLAVEAGDGARQPARLTAVARPSTTPGSGPILLPLIGPQPMLPIAPAQQAAISLVSPPPGTAGSQLPPTLSSMLGSHPLVHTFAGDLTVTAPNEGYPSRPPATPAAGTPTSTAGPGTPPGASQTPSHDVGGVPTGTGGGTLRIDEGDDDERTRNGLRKRLPREPRPRDTAPPPPTRQVIDLTTAARAAVDDSPAEVRARLTALRAGIQRGQGTGTITITPVRAAGSDHVVEDSE